MTDALAFVKAFERNCPNVRMTPDERAELLRLFFVCATEGAAAIHVEVAKLYEITKEVTHSVGFPWTDPRTGVTYPPPGKQP